MSLTLKIVSPDGVTYDSAAESVSLPTATGEITVLPHHVPLVTVLKPGEVRIKAENQEFSLAVSSGVVEIRPNSVVYVLAETAERAENIDVSRAEAARARAAELMARREQLDDEDFARLTASLEKELARLRVGNKYRNVGKV